ncbi:zinc ABC transporter substrate-binding protein [Candidatus Marithrix sp. Canyon 246]|uniref:zinc ABC transporter substrate-binding protein n=1 Tax=Candidatus Marithrix sp. Canyon 246 TaxID=1827136 RepID=UPI00084A2500|nr:zinc ABC transporter substrate-binding protein [Candidatus Marithrix sp. Canyon 246]
MIKKLKYITILTILAFNAQANEPKVVVTIAPIHSLVTEVMKGVAKPYLLLKPGESPHTYNLRPSKVRRLHAANLIIWVSSNIESFLEKSLRTIKVPKIQLIDLPNLKLLNTDPHIWLDPNNAQVMVQAIAASLAKIDSVHAQTYVNNANNLVIKIKALDQQLKLKLAPIQDLPYLVFHDAYKYFEHHYKLAAVASIKLSPEARLSVRRVYKLRRQIKRQNIRCIFSEPQFQSPLIRILTEDTSVKHGILDPLGNGSYFELLNGLAKSLTECLKTIRPDRF